MTECVVWIGCNRPEYSKPSLESILNSDDIPKDVYAFVDYSDGVKNIEVLDLVKQYPLIKLIHRPNSWLIECTALHALTTIYVKSKRFNYI